MVAQIWHLSLFGHAEGGLLALGIQAALDPVVVPRRDAEHGQLCLSLAVCTRHGFFFFFFFFFWQYPEPMSGQQQLGEPVADRHT